MKISFDLYTNSAELATKHYIRLAAVMDTNNENVSLNVYNGFHNLTGNLDYRKLDPAALKADGFTDDYSRLESNDYDGEELDWDSL